MQKQAEENEEIFWNVSFRLTRSTKNREAEEEYNEHGNPFDEKVIADEITSWLEDLQYKVNDIDVREAESMYDIFIGESSEGLEGADCPKCSHFSQEMIDDDKYDTYLEYDPDGFSEGTLYCPTCGFGVYIGTDGWKVTGFDPND